MGAADAATAGPADAPAVEPAARAPQRADDRPGVTRASLLEPDGAAIDRTALLDPPTPDDIDRLGRDAEGTRSLRALAPESIALVPLRASDRRLGSLLLASQGEPFDGDDLRFFEDLARRTAVALHARRLLLAERQSREAAERAAQRTANLQALATELGDAPTSDRVAEALVRQGLATLDADARALAVLAADERTFRLAGATGFPDEVVAAWSTFRSGDASLPAAAAASRTSIVVERPDERQRDAAEIVRALGEGSLLALPLVSEQRTVGVVVLFHAGRSLDTDELAYLDAVARQCVQPLVRARLRDQARDAARERADMLALLDTLVGTAPVGFGYWNRSLHAVRLNDAFARLLDLPVDRLLEQGIGIGLERDSAVRLERWLASVLRTREPIVERDIELRRADGSARRWMLSAYPVPSHDGDVSGVGVVVTDISDRARAEQTSQFLAEAGRVLGESLDYETTLANLARLAVPRMADWCSVEMLEPDGSLRRLAIAHVDPGKVELGRRFREQFPLRPDAGMGAPAVARTGEPEVIREVPQELIDSLVEDPEARRIVRELGVRSYMCVPIPGGGGVIGAITFVLAESGRTFDERDLALGTELARQAATAIEQARLYRDVTRLAATLDAVEDAILVFDPATLAFTYANHGAMAQVGYTREEFLRMTPLDVKPLYDERSYRALLNPLLSGELTSRTVNTLHRHKDGRLIPVEVSIQYVPLDGGDARLVSIARDVTQRVEAEARLHRLARSEQARAAEFAAMVGAIGDAVIVCSPAGDVTHSNPAAVELFGPDATTWDAVHAQLEDPEDAAPVPGRLERQGPVELRRDGREQWFALTAYPVFGDAPAAPERPVIATIVLARDVTEARHARRAQEAFIGVLSHELRTPVTTIYGGAKVLGERADSLAPSVREDVYRDIAAESERLYRLVEDLLVLARFDGVTPGSLGDEPVLLQRIVPGIVDVERSRFPATRFTTEIAPGLPTVRAERTYVEQVTRNLLGNAAKYSPPGSTVRLEVGQADGTVEVRVLDDGPGFPPEEAEKLFELFYRSPTTSRIASGAGIGLFVSRRLIEAMGGRIWALPRPEGGSEFGFALKTFTEEEA